MSKTKKRISSRTLYKFKPYEFSLVNPTSRRNHPTPRSGHRIVCDDVNIYSFGGYNPRIEDIGPELANDPVWIQNKPLFQELWSYNIGRKQWKKIICNGELPKELASNAVILNGSTLFIYGGTGVPFGLSNSNDLYVCLLKNGHTINKVEATGEVPLKQYGQAMILNNSCLYTIGGTTGFEYNVEVHSLNLHTNEWENLSNKLRQRVVVPEGRYRHELAFDGQKIYLLGGGTTEESFGFQRIYAFDLKLNEWELLPTIGDPEAPSPGFPKPRQCHGCVQLREEEDSNHGACAFIIGGSAHGGSYVYKDVWKLNLKTLKWTYIPSCSLPKRTFFHSSALTSYGKVFSFGGISCSSEADYIRISDLFSAWLCIPKLSEMCWEAFLHYNPDYLKIPYFDMLKMGVPMKYVKRLL